VKAYYGAVGMDFEGFSQKFGPAVENVLGAGGVKDSPEMRAYYKKHKEITSVDADHWGNPLNYQMLQALAQSIEALGSIDREAIADYVSTQFLLMTHSVTAVTALLAFGTATWIGLTYTIFPALTVKRAKPPLEKGVTGAWLLAVVATQSIAVLVSLIARDWPQPVRLELNFFALSTWLWGGVFYIWIISLIFYRYTFLSFSPGDLTPPYWINMGAMAISTLAGAQLVQNTPDAPILASLLPFLKGFTIFYWATGTWWIPMLLALSVWQYLIQRLPLRYDPLSWGAVFPLGMYTVATRQMAAVLELPFLNSFVPAMFMLALIAWTLACVGLLRDLCKLLRLR
jgi:tellurite resistance protein TehA-like permease